MQVINDGEQLSIIRGKINSNFSENSNTITTIGSNLSAEITDRQNAINSAISTEITNRNTAISDAISSEATARSLEISNAVSDIEDVLNGIGAIHLVGDILAISGDKNVAKNLFDTDTIFIVGKTLIYDDDKSIGVVIEDIDASTIKVHTMSTSTTVHTSILLGEVATYADLLNLTLSSASALFGITPNVGDSARILADEDAGGVLTERTVIFISGENIMWGEAIPINTSDYQEQTTVAMAGRLLSGGASAGTFGMSIGIASSILSGSSDLVTSGLIYTELENKSNRASMPTAGNIAGVNATGDVIDSGIVPNTIIRTTGANQTINGNLSLGETGRLSHMGQNVLRWTWDSDTGTLNLFSN